MRKKIIILLAIVVPVVVFLAGPRFEKPHLSGKLPDMTVDVQNVGRFVDSIESAVKVRPDNEARIVWSNDSLKNKTEYVVLYLSGFGASWYEGNPTHIRFAKAIGANLYLSRLASHGIDTSEQLIDMYPAALYESAKEALLIAQALGRKVIVMSTSTGGTLALKLASDFPDRVNSLILLSPNIAINNPAAFLLTGPWGLQIARMVGGGSPYRILKPKSEIEQKYWYLHQRWEGVVYLKQLVDATMSREVFQRVNQPVFLGYYYKNEKEQDPVVKVSAMLKMFDQLGTSDSLKVKVAFPDAGDHVIGCSDFSGSYLDVEEEIMKFARRIGIL
ncbi:MAG TPA: alpha/beta hydrolase [Prolixibacteraceae bacterium]|nr:alpha/beta hydrolase [Prolixibacteraceae bacterium]HPS11682.1 alpha/beta hydrolase [Prolixibacteraceae bacterium]